MQKFNIFKIIDLFIETVILALIFCLPIFFAWLPKLNNPFELGKNIFFKIFVLFIFWALVVKLIWTLREGQLARYIEHLKKLFSIVLFPFLFVAAISLSVLFSIDVELSWTGFYGRQQGFTSLLFYFLLFVLLLHYFQSKKQIYRALKAAAFSSILVCGYGIIQVAGLDFFKWSESFLETNRITSSLGQPNLLAMYLIMVIPLTIFLSFSSSKPSVKLFWWLLAGLQLICLFYAFSFTVWLAFVLALLFTVATYLFIRRLKARKIKLTWRSIIFGGGLILILVVLVFSLHDKWFFRSNINKLLNWQNSSLIARFQYWQAASRAIKERPIFGYGPETQREILVKYYERDWGIYGINLRPTRAHNIFIDTWLSSGIIGLIAYVWLLLYIGNIIFNNLKDKKKEKLSLFILFSLLGYVLSLQFQFTFIVGEVYFWFLLAILISLDNDFTVSKSFSSLIENKEPRKIGWRSLSWPVSLTIVISILITFFTGQLSSAYAADYYWREIRNRREANDFFVTLVLYRDLKEVFPRYGFYDREFSGMMGDWLVILEGIRMTKPAQEKLKTISKNLKSNNFSDVYSRAQLYLGLAAQDQEYFSSAQGEFARLIALSPEYPRTYRLLAIMHELKGEYDKAIENYELAIEKLPDSTDPRLNPMRQKEVEEELSLIYFGLGNSYFKKEQYDLATNAYNTALLLNSENIWLYGELAKVEEGREAWEEALAYYKHAKSLEPDNYYWPLKIAELYQKLGNNEQANIYQIEAEELKQNSS